VPPIPDKEQKLSMGLKGQFSKAKSNFVQDRQFGLQKFLERVAGDIPP
jgi:hypothetical protein